MATARRLGAVVEASDVRPAVKEQIESLGAKFIDVPYETDEEREAAAGVGGYARPMPPSWLERQAKAAGYLDSDKSVAGVQFLVDLYKEGQIPNAIIGNEGATKTQDGMPNGEYATILDGPWMDQIWAGARREAPWRPGISKSRFLERVASTVQMVVVWHR